MTTSTTTLYDRVLPASLIVLGAILLYAHTLEAPFYLDDLPALIDKQCRPELLKNGDPRFDDAVRYMDWASDEMNRKFIVKGDEVIVTPA